LLLSIGYASQNKKDTSSTTDKINQQLRLEANRGGKVQYITDITR